MRRAALFGGVLVVSVLAVLVIADSRSINFEHSQGYTLGSIQGQNGWGGQTPLPINPAIDQAVVNTSGRPASFGGQSWRISNYFTSGSFGDMPFSPSLANEAGETMAQNNGLSGGARQNHFETQWSFATADPGPGTDCATTNVTCSYLSMAPDRGDGARMSYIRLEDDVSGLRVLFDDYQDRSPYGALGTPLTATQGCGLGDDFVETLVASGLDRRKAHTVKLTMDFVDGPRNDVVKVYVDGTLRHTGTSWEDYFRWCTESGGGTGTTASDQSRTVDSMIFTVRGGEGFLHPLNQGNGFFIDNLSYFTSRGECRDGDGDGDFDDEKDGHRHHCHFHHDSCEDDHDGHHDGGDVEDDDRDSGKHFESNSASSSTYTSDANSQTLTMIGTGLHGGLPVGFTMIAVDNGDLLPGRYLLILTDGYRTTGRLAPGAILIR
jgi:hypothetical protein